MPAPADYYPNSTCDILLLVWMLLVTCGGSLGMMVGFLYWDFEIGNDKFVLIWSMVLIAFTAIMLIAIYFGGKDKITNERKMVKDRLQEMKHASNAGVATA